MRKSQEREPHPKCNIRLKCAYCGEEVIKFTSTSRPVCLEWRCQDMDQDVLREQKKEMRMRNKRKKNEMQKLQKCQSKGQNEGVAL